MAEWVTRTDLQSTVQNAVALPDGKIEAQTLRLTVRLGGLPAAGIAVLAAVRKRA